MRGSEEYVAIGRKNNKSPLNWLRAPLIDKFFILGVAAGAYGTIVLGLRLWLILGSVLEPAPHIDQILESHALTQFYFFLGSFVLGFVLHAGPRLLGVRTDSNYLGAIVLFLQLTALIFLIAGNNSWARIIVSANFSLAALYLLSVVSKAAYERIVAAGVLLLLGVTSLAVGAHSDLSQPANALIVFWAGFGALFLAAGQQFIVAFLQGTKLNPRSSIFLLLLFVLSVLLGWLSTFNSELVSIFGASAFTVILFFVQAAGLYSRGKSLFRDALVFSFLTGFTWAFLGWAAFIVWGAGVANVTLHLLALGWAVPITLSVSVQILTHLLHKHIIPARIVLNILFVWQLVPLTRALSQFTKLPDALLWIVSAIVVLLFICWCAIFVSAKKSWGRAVVS